MPTHVYSVNQYSIQTLLTWVQIGEIAIPEIQRPFVWDATKVRNLLDSLLQGYPIGYLIAWRNPTVRLKDGSSSAGKRILIDGQQRITALMAALLGIRVVTKDYESVRVQIAYNPISRKLEVSNPIIRSNTAWIPDVAAFFSPSFLLLSTVREYCARNPGANDDDVLAGIDTLRSIVNNTVGLIELSHDLSIETVTEIFIRVNSMGTSLSQSDFAMSKIASTEKFGGHELRKAIDYFCHLAVQPDFYNHIVERDPDFARTDYYPRLAWLKSETDEIYDPGYADVLRVVFTSQFKRGRTEDLVALLSGRDFETKQFIEAIAEDTFARMRVGVMNFINETRFKQLLMIIRSAGFVDSSMVSSYSNINMAYVIFHLLKDQGVASGVIERSVRRWFVMSILTSRYSGSTESAIDFDVRQIAELGYEAYWDNIRAAQLSDTYWNVVLPQQLETSSVNSPFWAVYRAAQVTLHDKGFLSRDISVHDLITLKSDVHHLFPRSYLKKFDIARGRYNQVANFAVTQSEINIAIGGKPPREYMGIVYDQILSGAPRIGGISDQDMLDENLRRNCLPAGFATMTVDSYDNFLKQRRTLMAERIHMYFDRL